MQPLNPHTFCGDRYRLWTLWKCRKQSSFSWFVFFFSKHTSGCHVMSNAITPHWLLLPGNVQVKKPKVQLFFHIGIWCRFSKAYLKSFSPTVNRNGTPLVCQLMKVQQTKDRTSTKSILTFLWDSSCLNALRRHCWEWPAGKFRAPHDFLMYIDGCATQSCPRE